MITIETLDDLELIVVSSDGRIQGLDDGRFLLNKQECTDAVNDESNNIELIFGICNTFYPSYFKNKTL
jgi:hypothetical protein